MPFVDRTEAGRVLGDRLRSRLGSAGGLVVLGLPRGGVPVAHEVARALGAPLDVIVVRKLGVPHQPELAMGAIGEDGVRVVNQEVFRLSTVTPAELAAVEERERAELERRARLFRGRHERIDVTGRTAVVVDDGVATGSTARAACQVARAHGAARVVLAVPVAPPGWTDEMRDAADDLFCLETPGPFFAVGQWYRDFRPTTDAEVIDHLDAARAEHPPDATTSDAARTPARPGAGGPGVTATDADVVIETDGILLPGHLTVAADAPAIVVFAHGSGSSRHSPRNQFVARRLNDAGLGTLLLDLLTPAEEHDRTNVFDIRLLAGRLHGAVAWLRAQACGRATRIGLFGASTGAGAALWAAAEPGAGISAVVSRGGRPDLAGERLPLVASPTLLIVGGRDEVVLDLNRAARARLRCENRLEVVAGATHLFEEPGTLEAAADLARGWFVDHLARPARSPA